jgi:nucleoid DNA-binding protein
MPTVPCRTNLNADGSCPNLYPPPEKVTCSGSNIAPHAQRLKEVKRLFPDLSNALVARVVNAYLARVVDDAAEGKCARMRGVGSVSVRQRKYVEQTRYRLGIDTTASVKAMLNADYPRRPPGGRRRGGRVSEANRRLCRNDNDLLQTTAVRYGTVPFVMTADGNCLSRNDAQGLVRQGLMRDPYTQRAFGEQAIARLRAFASTGALPPGKRL